MIPARLTPLLVRRLRREGMQDVEVKADTVDMPSGQLAALYVLAFPHSLPDELKAKMDLITLEECARYLQKKPTHNVNA